MTDAPSYAVSRKVPVEQWANQQTGEYAAIGVLPISTGTLALVANQLTIFPFFNPLKCALTNVGAVVTTGVNTTSIRFALFDWDVENEEVKALVKDYGTPLGSEVADQGLIEYTSLTDELDTGWYAWGLVSDGAPTVRTVEGVDPYLGQNLVASTTNLNGIAHYTATGTGMHAGGITDPGAYADLTKVTATFLRNMPVVTRQVNLPAFT